ncbi:MAG: NAD-dependent epimerase [Balneolaceae bacterium]|nr:MAG: NAD-dependent epimerase [Balneolaceae bacterium]
MKVLITGAAGFIGYHLSKRMIEKNIDVVGLDNLNDYYSVNLKYERLNLLGIEKNGMNSLDVLNQSKTFSNFSFIKCDLSDQAGMEKLFNEHQFDVVINLAAQAGVRYSLENPHAYTSSNVTGFLNILEGCRHHKIKHLIFASSSSVYGANQKMPFEVSDRTDHPVSLYAATKKSNELMAHTYAHLYGIPCTGLRFFTVYGPLGRPDMAYFKFANLISEGKPIDVYNHGKMARDFTYIDDIVEGIIRLVPKVPKGFSENGSARRNPDDEFQPLVSANYQIFNIGNGTPVNLLDFIEILEEQLGLKTSHNMMTMQPGDVVKTWADVSDLYKYIQYKPKVNIQEGITRFVEWYHAYYGNLQKS